MDLLEKLGIKSQRTKQISKQVILSVFYKGGGILASFLLVPITINYLNTTNYGIWLVITSFAPTITLLPIFILGKIVTLSPIQTPSLIITSPEEYNSRLFGSNIDFETTSRLHGKLNEELPIPYFIDVINFNTIDVEELKQHILNEGIVIFERLVD